MKEIDRHANIRRVLYYVERYLPASQAFIAQQANALTRFQPSFLAGTAVNSASRELVKAPVRMITDSRSTHAGELALKIFRLPLPALFPCVRDTGLVHAHFGKNGYVIGPLARAAGLPLVTTFHGFDATFAGDPRAPGGFNQVRYFARGRAEMARWPNHWAVAVSDFIRDKLIELEFPPSRILRHYVGIDTDLFSVSALQRTKGLVVSIARFVEYKGHRFMIEALEKVARQGLPIEFAMVGEGPDRDKVEAFARSRLPKVTVYQNLSQSEVRQLLSRAELYLHGSVTLSNGHAEAFGLANLEAAAVGTPVVAFRSGGVGEALEDGVTGYLVPERDVTGMSSAIGKILTNPILWAEFSRRSPDFVRDKFDIKAQTARLEDYYDAVLAEHSALRNIA